MAGHILGAYGLASLWLGWLFLRRAEGTLLVWSAIAAAHTRLGTWLFVSLAGRILSFGGHAVMLLGFWAARRRVLEEPQHHLGCCGGRRSWAGDRLAGWAPGGARPHRRAGGPARRRLRARGAAADRRRHRARRRPGIRGPVRPDRLPDPRMGATTSRRGRGGRGGQALALLLPGPLVARRAPAGRLGWGTAGQRHHGGLRRRGLAGDRGRSLRHGPRRMARSRRGAAAPADLRHGHQSARWETGYSMARRSRSSRLSQARRVRRAGSA